MVSIEPHTIQDLLKLGWASEKRELIAGRLFDQPLTSFAHGELQLTLSTLLRQYVLEHRLGKVVVESGFVMTRDPDTVLGPDIAFVSNARLPADPERFSTIPPDLVAEILSPGDRQADVDRKVAIYLEHGVRVVWIVIRGLVQVVQHLPGAPAQVYEATEVIDGGDVLPGFSLPLAAIFGE